MCEKTHTRPYTLCESGKQCLPSRGKRQPQQGGNGEIRTQHSETITLTKELSQQGERHGGNLPVEPIVETTEEPETRDPEAEDPKAESPEEQHKMRGKTARGGTDARGETQRERPEENIGEQKEEEDARKDEDEDTRA
ncbi:hypothetical protein NDU88_006846 [Pleurodeles waltl]|uniref:Uncharacterized protein n=1 Tax=Pleurodeles waltl TaxID=8319 RepID=A0AAV7RRF2_PLEWA|nr:hypothetical protein NDU88_006846 [Pleurodeles waltl]